MQIFKLFVTTIAISILVVTINLLNNYYLLLNGIIIITELDKKVVSMKIRIFRHNFCQPVMFDD